MALGEVTFGAAWGEGEGRRAIILLTQLVSVYNPWVVFFCVWAHSPIGIAFSSLLMSKSLLSHLQGLGTFFLQDHDFPLVRSTL